MKNSQIFQKDPTRTKIPNDGVSKVGRPETESQWDVLTWELESFVCEGEYERGLDRILSSYLTNLGHKQQPAIWVSGFYGSGKSHLCRVLEYLWLDLKLPQGTSTRNLVHLPPEIAGHLAQLSIAGKRRGGLWSAAGTLGAGRSQSVRLAFLSVIFESAGLPELYPLARFVMWAREQGYLERLKTAVEDAGKEFGREVSSLYVSPLIARTLQELDSSLGSSVKDVRDLLKAQFPPQPQDVTDDEMFAVMEDVIRGQSDTPGEYPLTLIVLDEMQQYLGDDHAKTLAVQNIVEGVTSRFDNSVLFVATGQSAMGATPTLQKLTDRFPLQIQLSDKDVETVVREVILRKKPDKVEALEQIFSQSAGEIDRHLGGTRIAAVADDKKDLAADYPLLPTRRRFWEIALRALDQAGKAGVLRTQLRIIHEATRSVADETLGHVVGADFLYDQQAPALQQSGVLLKEIDELVRGLKTEGSNGALKARICALIFIISKIEPQIGSGGLGLRPTAPFLADLLVEKLDTDGADLRKRVPLLLDELEHSGKVMRLDDEYRLQTKDGADWEGEYRTRLSAIKDDASRLGTLRNERLTAAVDASLSGLKLKQGKSATSRRLGPSWGPEEPDVAGSDVPLWIRDGWGASESAIRDSAAAAGDDSPIVFVLLPKQDAETIKETLASHAAARETIQARPTPQTDEGKEALRAMNGRLSVEEDRLQALFRGVVANAHVYQGGGHEIDGLEFRDRIATAADRSLTRLFPRFDVADHPDWGKVTTRARDGAPDSLTAVGYTGDVDKHPVTKEILGWISASGSKGADLIKRYEGTPFGWPTDALRGAVMALLASRHITAKRDGRDLTVKQLEPRQLGGATLYREDDPPSAKERIAVRGLLSAAKIPSPKDDEEQQIPALLQKLLDLAEGAGGDPPFPARPDVAHIESLRALSGNGRFRAVAAAFDTLNSDLDAWSAAGVAKEARQARWSELERLLVHAGGLPLAPQVRTQYEAIRDQRQLLHDPDPVRPLIDQLTSALRDEIKRLAEELAAAQSAAIVTLDADSLWIRLASSDRDAILREVDLRVHDAPDVSSDARVLALLDETSLPRWREQISYVATRVDQARAAAAKKLEPKSVQMKVPSATLRTESELTKYLEDLRASIQRHIDKDETVVI